MKIKPLKCRSLSIIKENYREIKFSVDGNEIPTIREKNVKCLGYSSSLPFTDQHRWQDLSKMLKDVLRSIDECDLFNKDRVGVFILDYFRNYHGQYLVSITKVETMEGLITKYTKVPVV